VNKKRKPKFGGEKKNKARKARKNNFFYRVWYDLWFLMDHTNFSVQWGATVNENIVIIIKLHISLHERAK